MNYVKYKLRQLFCKHDYVLHEELHGDERNACNARYVFKCTKCGKLKFL